MSQHSPFPSSNRSLSFARNGHSPHASGTPGSSGLDGQPRPTDVDPLILHSFGNASSIASGFLGDLDIANPSSVQNTMGPPDDRARFAGLEYDRLFQFYHDQDEPWNQEKSRVRGQYDPLPSSFTGFRDTVAPSECETSIGPGTLQSDSGYGSQARQSVGIPSVYGEVDRSSEAIMNQLAGFQMPSESIHGSSQVHDVNHLGHSWNQVTLGRPDGMQANNTPKFQCQHCPKTFRSQSDHKKHTARHEKPHKCPERGCSKATKGFGTINDLERHLKSVHRKDGTRYRCHHGSCLTKAKDWPRPDNFRSHLKKIHNISLEAGDSLEDYIHRSVNPEILSNVGVSLELVPPAVHGSSAPHSWSQLERDTHVHRSGIGGSSEEILLDRRDVYLPPPAHPRFTNASGLDNHDASSSSGSRYSRSRLESQQDHDRDPVEDDNVLQVTSDRHQDLPRSREMAHQGVPSEENVEYVRPDDLNNASHGALEPASPAEDTETEAIVLDEDDEVGASDGIDSNDDDFQVKSFSSPGTATKLPESVNKFDPAAVEDGAKRHKQQAVTGSLEDNGSDSDDLVKPGTPLPLGEAFASLSEELDETDPERAEAAFQKLMLKLGDTRMEKLLRTHGYVKPKGPQTRQKSASQQLPIACLEPGCPKSFNRPCEMKKHLKRHEKPYGCTQCQKRFGSKNDWKRHENSQHFQHEIWKCEEKLNTPLSDTCNKVCHRRETFKQHLVSHHGIDSQRLEDKLDRSRIGRLGEARFWCGFCKDVIELETEKNAHDACNARYNHIDDHYSGRNGAVKREAGEWQFGDSDAAEADTKAPPQGDEAKEEMAALPQVSELRKRSRHGTGPTPKRARFSPPREDIMWYCCQCNNPWSFANNPSCISCPRHMRCGDCRVEEIEPTEAGPSGDAE